MTTENTIKEIQEFLEGKNNDVKYLVNVETDNNHEYATCVIHEPNKTKQIVRIPFTSFIYFKDLKKVGYKLFDGNVDKYKAILQKYDVTITKMKTGNHPRLENGYPYKASTTKSFSMLIKFFEEAGLNPYQKIYDDRGKILKDNRGFSVSKYRDLFYLPKLNEQFFISTGIRLFKGFEEYNDVHKLTFDIETTGLRYEHSRIFAIGMKDNKGFEHVLEVEKPDDDESEKIIIQDFFNLITYINPAIISGYNSEMFDYDFILGRARLLGMDVESEYTKNGFPRKRKKEDIPKNRIQTTLIPEEDLWRKKGSTVKFGNSTEKYNQTIAYGFTILDIIHAVKKTAAVNSEIKNNKLKYICKYEDIAKPNRMYIHDGKDIGRFWHKNPMFILNSENNDYIEIPAKFYNVSSELYFLQENKDKISDDEYKVARNELLKPNPEFVEWLRPNIIKLNPDKFSSTTIDFKFENGKNILRRYLLDDLWETEQVDNLYNQSSFLLAKIVPTIYSRVATMGNAAVWNLLMTAWSYENDLAIPHPDDVERFSGGLARCYKKGYTKRLLKIDYASLYPMIQLTHDVFPMFDITGVIKKMLTYMTTTRNIYKKLGNEDKLTDNEIELLKTIDNESYQIFFSGKFTKEQINIFIVKQLPIKILNNSLFGALGSGYAFNWSDNICAARITTTGRIYLRQAIDWFNKFGLIPLLAVTDGINFSIPDTTTIRATNEGVSEGVSEGVIEEMWEYNNKTGVSALIEKFNDYLKDHYTSLGRENSYLSVDNDGEFDSCLNLSRINYALMSDDIDKETGKPKQVPDPNFNGCFINKKKIKFTGNTIKSKTMPEFIEDFIDESMKLILDGNGEGFIEYYYNYSETIFYKQIPLKKIASKSRIKNSIDDYLNRGTNKNGKLKAKQVHMELIIAERENIARKIFENDFEKFKDDDNREIGDYDIMTIIEKVETYMPPEPELDTTVYYVNTGTRKSHGDVKSDSKTGETIIKARLINQKDLEENPETTGDYNVEKYLAAFNKRVKVLLDGFDAEIRDEILVKIVRKKIEDASGAKVEQIDLKKGEFKSDQLVLKNFNHDDYEDSMYLEDREVDFWNKTGYDPRLIWDGFKTKDVEKYGLVNYEIYNHALNYLSDAMEKSGKSRIKSINDKTIRGDYVLIKNIIKVGDITPLVVNASKPKIENKYVYKNGNHWVRDKYTIGYNNGEFIEILKKYDDVKVPLSPTEHQWEEAEKVKEAELQKLRVEDVNYINVQKEKIVKERMKKIEYFKSFVKDNNIPPHYDMDELFEKVPNVKLAFDDYVNEKEADFEPDIYFDEGDL